MLWSHHSERAWELTKVWFSSNDRWWHVSNISQSEVNWNKEFDFTFWCVVFWVVTTLKSPLSLFSVCSASGQANDEAWCSFPWAHGRFKPCGPCLRMRTLSLAPLPNHSNSFKPVSFHIGIFHLSYQISGTELFIVFLYYLFNVPGTNSDDLF